MTLEEKHLRHLNEKQREIVVRQSIEHRRETYQTDFDVSGSGDIFRNFVVEQPVFDPFLSSAHYHARFLFYNPKLWQGKNVLDLGCGSGILGIVMSKYGAKHVTFSDISKAAVDNTKTNLGKYHLNNVGVIESDLFERINSTYDVIVWNIPFFPGNPPKDDTIANSMMMPAELFEKFLDQATQYLNPNGKLVIPSYDVGGDLNNPRIVGPKHGYDYATVWHHEAQKGIQQGTLFIDELVPKETS